MSPALTYPPGATSPGEEKAEKHDASRDDGLVVAPSARARGDVRRRRGMWAVRSWAPRPPWLGWSGLGVRERTRRLRRRSLRRAAAASISRVEARARGEPGRRA